MSSLRIADLAGHDGFPWDGMNEARLSIFPARSTLRAGLTAGDGTAKMGGDARFHNTPGAARSRSSSRSRPARSGCTRAGRPSTITPISATGGPMSSRTCSSGSSFIGLRVTHVMNITDVDDKTIKGANAKGVGLDEYTKPFIEAFASERDRLNILRPTTIPGDGVHPRRWSGSSRSSREGHRLPQGRLDLFRHRQFPAYGRLSKISLEDLRPGSRGARRRVREGERPRFRPVEGAQGGRARVGDRDRAGRPAGISSARHEPEVPGADFDIHCGGVDNIFPHHGERDRPSSEAAHGVKFVHTWRPLPPTSSSTARRWPSPRAISSGLSDVLARGFACRGRSVSSLCPRHYRQGPQFHRRGPPAGPGRAGTGSGISFSELRHVERDLPPNPAAARAIEEAGRRSSPASKTT